MKKIKCANCDEVRDKDSEEFYKYQGKTYCYACLEEYYNDEMAILYFDEFIKDECEVIE